MMMMNISNSTRREISSSTCASISSNVEGLSRPQPLPYEVVLLISQYLDPRSLAMASCVCKSWCNILSSDHLWKPLFLSYHPSLSSLRRLDRTVSYSSLFARGHTASAHRHRRPSKPLLSLSNLIFTVDVFCGDSPFLSLAKAGDDLLGSGGSLDSEVFRFKFDVTVGERTVVTKSSEALRVAMMVVLKGLKGVFCMIDWKVEGKVVGGREKVFSEELPLPRCCAGVATGSGLVAEVGLGFCGAMGEEEVRVENVSIGLMSVLSLRYVGIEDGLRYLQHFLMMSSSV